MNPEDIAPLPKLFDEMCNLNTTEGGRISPSGPWGIVSELLFEKKGLIPVIQQLFVSRVLRWRAQILLSTKEH